MGNFDSETGEMCGFGIASLPEDNLDETSIDRYLSYGKPSSQLQALSRVS